MTPDEMLEVLDEYGGDAGSDLNDADNVLGWFGWTITTDGVLVVTYEPDIEGDPGPQQVASWRLVPLAAPSVSEPAGETA